MSAAQETAHGVWFGDGGTHHGLPSSPEPFPEYVDYEPPSWYSRPVNTEGYQVLDSYQQPYEYPVDSIAMGYHSNIHEHQDWNTAFSVPFAAATQAPEYNEYNPLCHPTIAQHDFFHTTPHHLNPLAAPFVPWSNHSAPASINHAPPFANEIWTPIETIHGSYYAPTDYLDYYDLEDESVEWNTDSFPEHVLKHSVSNSGLAPTIENIHPPTTAKVTQPASTARNNPINTGAVKKPSPTPSVKRSKANKLLEAHGSPPTFRVTAGGHVVFNEFSLGSPRYPPGAHQRQKYQNNNHGPMNAAQVAIPNGFVAYNTDKQLCQWVHGCMWPLQQGPQGPLLLIPSPNYPFPTITGANPGFTSVPPPSTFPPNQLAYMSNGPVPSALGNVDAQIQYSRECYATLEREKLEHERNEVHIKDKLPPHERAQMIDRKRHLIVELDSIRKMIKGLETQKQVDHDFASRLNRWPPPADSGYAPGPGFNNPPPPPAWVYPSGVVQPPYPYMPYSSENIPQNVGMPIFAPNAPSGFEERGAYEGPEGAKPMANNFYAADAPTTTLTALTLDGQSSSKTELSLQAEQRRSCAVEIKDPHNSTAGPKQASILDPTSPVYEPGKPISPNTNEILSPSPWSSNGRDKRSMRPVSPTRVLIGKQSSSSQQPGETSEASYTTTDFFPEDAHEHSLKKYRAQHTSLDYDDSKGSARHTPNHPRTPGRLDQYHNVGYPFGTLLPSPNSPLELALPKAPQPSPADGFRVSSLIRDVHPTGTSSVVAPMDWELEMCGERLHSTTEETPLDASKNGFSSTMTNLGSPAQSGNYSQSYLDGLVAGLAGTAPGRNRHPSFVQGYIAGLSKSTAGRQSLHSLSTGSLKSDRVTPTQPPNTAVPSLHERENVANARLNTESPVPFSTDPDNENVKLEDWTMSAYTPTKRNSYGLSPRIKLPLAYPLTLRLPMPNRVFSGSLDIESRSHAFFEQGGGNTSEDPSYISVPSAEGLRAAHTLTNQVTAPLTEHSGNETTASNRPGAQKDYNEDQMPPKPQYGKSGPRSRTRSTPNHVSMDGAADHHTVETPGSSLAEMSKLGAGCNTDATVTKSSPMNRTKSPSSTSPSKTAGCSPKKFSPSKAKATLHNFLHSGSNKTDKDSKDVRETSSNPTKMDAHQKGQWKNMWSERFKEIKARDKAEKGEHPDLGERRKRHPLPDRQN